MGNEIKKQFFWTDDSGTIFGDDELKEQSKTWDREQWEQYLKGIESSLVESQIDVTKFDLIASSQLENIFVHSQETASAELFAKLHNALLTLTPQQRAVIDLLFYKSKSHRETARELSISQSRVRDLRNHAIKKLKSELQRGALSFPIVDKQKKEKENV